ncbi:hypothetical protein SDC9_117461 [bioreactor metagenome]|uniref:Uncharacterized protein n=1 Tax=bioreactor metagenome TaxID=1076179 RepID=A0A645BYA3_9ZZZZ
MGVFARRARSVPLERRETAVGDDFAENHAAAAAGIAARRADRLRRHGFDDPLFGGERAAPRRTDRRGADRRPLRPEQWQLAVPPVREHRPDGALERRTAVRRL